MCRGRGTVGFYHVVSSTVAPLDVFRLHFARHGDGSMGGWGWRWGGARVWCAECGAWCVVRGAWCAVRAVRARWWCRTEQNRTGHQYESGTNPEQIQDKSRTSPEQIQNKSRTNHKLRPNPDKLRNNQTHPAHCQRRLKNKNTPPPFKKKHTSKTPGKHQKKHMEDT